MKTYSTHIESATLGNTGFVYREGGTQFEYYYRIGKLAVLLPLIRLAEAISYHLVPVSTIPQLSRNPEIPSTMPNVSHDSCELCNPTGIKGVCATLYSSFTYKYNRVA